ncbi:MAG: DUF885 domain-containing protein [Bacteroidota bacterium]
MNFSRLSLVPVLLAVVIACGGCAGGLGLVQTDADRFEDFVARFVEGTLWEKEADAPAFGLLRRGADSLRAARADRALALLAALDTASLTIDQRIDWLQLEAHFKREIHDTSLRRLERIPLLYLTVGGIYWQVAGDRVPTPRGWERILSTLEEAPIALKLGRDQLVDPPALWVDLAANTARRYEEFLREVLSPKIRTSAPDSLQARLLPAADAAAKDLAGYRAFLTDSLTMAPEGSWAVGEEYYDWLLREFHFLPYTASQMIEEGRKIHLATKQALDSLARTIDPGRTWKELVEEMKTHHPEPYRIMEAYGKESDRARQLILSRDLITIPPAETLTMVPTPPALRETYAWGGYGGIEMRDSLMVGRFFVTDIGPEMTQAEMEEKLRTQNTGWLTVIALHEGYPGHHLQTVYARNNPRTIRNRLGSTYYGEGWALYCESWMGREGFYVDAWDSLGWLQMRLWRTARVIIDPSIHTGRMTYEEAVQFFMQEVGLERSAAEAEVNRYTTWPTQAPSYIIGWLEIERLKEEVMHRLGPGFRERTFLEHVLSIGSLPLELMKRGVRARYGFE